MDQPELPRDLRDQALTAQLQAVAGLRDHRGAGRIAGGVLAAPSHHGVSSTRWKVEVCTTNDDTVVKTVIRLGRRGKRR